MTQGCKNAGKNRNKRSECADTVPNSGRMGRTSDDCSPLTTGGIAQTYTRLVNVRSQSRKIRSLEPGSEGGTENRSNESKVYL